jgi:hypothetical protein
MVSNIVRLALALLLASCLPSGTVGQPLAPAPTPSHKAVIVLPPKILVTIVNNSQSKIEVREEVSGCNPPPNEMPLKPDTQTIDAGSSGYMGGRIANCLPDEWVSLSANLIVNSFTKCLLNISYDPAANIFDYLVENSGYGSPQSECTVSPANGTQTTFTYALSGSKRNHNRPVNDVGRALGRT